MKNPRYSYSWYGYFKAAITGLSSQVQLGDIINDRYGHAIVSAATIIANIAEEEHRRKRRSEREDAQAEVIEERSIDSDPQTGQGGRQ